SGSALSPSRSRSALAILPPARNPGRVYMSRRRTGAWSAVIVGLALTVIQGCDRYILVESRLVESGRPMVGPEITATPHYHDAVATVHDVALLAPDSCAREGAAEATGAASRTATIVTTDCGVWMAELERSLSKAGYRVASWKAVNGIVNSERLSAIAAAQRL